MYLRVDETYTRLEILEEQYPGLVQRIELDESTNPEASRTPQPMWALRVRTASTRAKHGILIIGGLHGNEWGNTDIVMHYIEVLIDAYDNNTGIQYGSKSYSPQEIQNALDSVDIFLVPVANPDGRAYSMEEGDDEFELPKNMWRKNRSDNSFGLCFGVDLNRNFDWLWDYRTTMHPEASWENGTPCQGYIAVSDNPCGWTYHGPAAFSEPETRNIKSLFDDYPHIRFFVDVHGTKGIVLYPWGDDEIQTTDPNMNFRNPAYDGLRGLADDIIASYYNCSNQTPNPDGAAYKEYMNPTDLARLSAFGALQRDAINAVRGQAYTTAPGFTGLYGITGGTKDYGFGRHLSDPTLGKVDTFLYEYGIDTGAQPPYETPPGPDDMIHVIHDCASGLTELTINADRVPNVTISPPTLDFGRQRSGTAKSVSFSIHNQGQKVLLISSVSVLADNAGVFAATSSAATLQPGQSTVLAATSTPANAGQFEAFVAVDFVHEGDTVADVRMIPCKVDVCSVPPNACVAPVFEPLGLVICMLLYMTIPLILAFLSLFIWIPGVACLIQQLLFLLQNCASGNSDPCIVLLRNRRGYR
jgi:hypothetical protein